MIIITMIISTMITMIIIIVHGRTEVQIKCLSYLAELKEAAGP